MRQGLGGALGQVGKERGTSEAEEVGAGKRLSLNTGPLHPLPTLTSLHLFICAHTCMTPD